MSVNHYSFISIVTAGDNYKDSTDFSIYWKTFKTYKAKRKEKKRKLSYHNKISTILKLH